MRIKEAGPIVSGDEEAVILDTGEAAGNDGETSDRALFTGVPEDYGAIMESGYAGKVVFHVNYLGWPFYFLCDRYGWMLLAIIAMAIVAVLLFCYMRDPLLMERYLSRRFRRRW